MRTKPASPAPNREYPQAVQRKPVDRCTFLYARSTKLNNFEKLANSDLHTAYRGKHGLWTNLKEEAVHTLEAKLRQANLKTHSVGARVKSLDSIEAKLRDRVANNLGVPDGSAEPPHPAYPLGLKDVVGIRVVCMFLSQIEQVVDVIKEAFSVIEEDRKIATSEAASFGYMSDHFVCQLHHAVAGPRYDDIKTIAFEIQVRTIAMDAWAAVSHHLAYKNEIGVPAELRKDFFALSGLFYVADTHFEMFYKQVEVFRKRLEIDPNAATFTDDNQLNVDTLAVYLNKRFPNREHSESSEVDRLFMELNRAGYKNLKEVDIDVYRGEPALLAFELDHPPADPDTGTTVRYTDIGALRGALDFVHSDFQELRYKLRGGQTVSFPRAEDEKYRKLVRDRP